MFKLKAYSKNIAQARKVCQHTDCQVHKYLKSSNIRVCENRCHRHNEASMHGNISEYKVKEIV